MSRCDDIRLPATTPRFRTACAWGVLTLLVCLLVAAGARAQDGFSLDLVAVTGTEATIAEICCPAAAGTPLPDAVLETAFGANAYWLRLHGVAREGLLTINAVVDEADLFAVLPDGRVITEMQTGDTRPASGRPYPSARMAFPLAGLDPQAELYLRIVQKAGLALRFQLTDADTFEREAARTATIRAGLLGAVAVMVLFNLALAVAVRDSIFLLNALTIAGLFMLDIYLSGIGAAYVWPEAPWLSNRIVNLATLLPVIFGGLFIYLFLSDGTAQPRAPYKLTLVPPAVGVVLLPVIFAMPYWVAQLVIYVPVVALITIIAGVCTRESLAGNRRAMVLLVPLLCGIVPGLSATAAQLIFGVDTGAVRPHMLEITLVLEALLFSLALGYRLRLSQSERETIRREFVGHVARSERRLLAAVDEERSRIATDLHDTAGQGLVAIVNRLVRAARRGDTPAPLRGELETVADVTRETVSQLRRISHDLHSATLAQLGLRRAIAALAEHADAGSDMSFSVDNELADEKLEPEQAQHVYRIAQELVANAVKHSAGGRCLISLKPQRDQAVLEVSDDGAAASAAARPGLGTELVAQRVRCLNGAWTVHRGEDGTTVSVRFPLDAQGVEP